MRGAEAEADARLGEPRGRKADGDDGNAALEHLDVERAYLGRHVEHERHDWRVVVAVHDEAHGDEALAEVVRVPGELGDALLAVVAAVDARYDAQRGLDLLRDGRAHAGRVAVGVRVSAYVVDELLGAGYVAAARAEALGEGAHHDVDVLGRAVPVVDDAATRRAESANAVRLVQVQVGLVLLLELDDLGQVDDGALHAVDALDYDEYLLPRTVRAILAVDDRFLKLLLQIIRICSGTNNKRNININIDLATKINSVICQFITIVFEDLNGGARQARAEHERGVVELVAEYEAALADQIGNVGGVGGEAHAEDDGALDAEEGGHTLLDLAMDLERAELLARRARGHRVLADGRYRVGGALAVVLGKAEVVVRAQVERLDESTAALERPVEVIGDALNDRDDRARHRADRSVEAVAYSCVQVARVEALVLGEERHEVGRVVVLGALFLLEARQTHEVAYPAEHVEYQIADVGDDGRPQRRLLERLLHFASSRRRLGRRLDHRCSSGSGSNS